LRSWGKTRCANTSEELNIHHWLGNGRRVHQILMEHGIKLLRRGSEELFPIYRSCVFRSDVRAESHQHVAQELAEHELRWKRGMADTAFFKGTLGQLEMYVLRYGAEVDVRPRLFDGFALVHMSLRGAAEIECDGMHVDLAEGRTALIAPRRDIRMRWHAGTEQLILKVPLTLIERVLIDGVDNAALAPASLIPARHASHWDLLLKSLLNVVRLRESSRPDSAWLDHFERNVATFLLTHRDVVAARPFAAPLESGNSSLDELEAVGTDTRRLEAMVRYMEQRLAAPVSLYDLSTAAGVSTRTLNTLCHRHLGETPMNLLRNMRLDAVRARLLAQPESNITSVALEFGFGHVGRFASYYAERYGELPRRTGGRAVA
jgi:AraC-like DNA-binding protein